MTSPLGFKARVGSTLFKLSEGMCYVIRSLRFTSGATPASLLAASMAAEPSLPHTCKALVGLETGSYHATTHSVRSGRPEVLPTELSRLGCIAVISVAKIIAKHITRYCIGLAVPLVGVNAFATAAPLIDKMVVVSEEFIALAILRLVEMEKAVVEGAGATGIAAVLAGLLPELEGKKYAFLVHTSCQQAFFQHVCRKDTSFTVFNKCSGIGF